MADPLRDARRRKRHDDVAGLNLRQSGPPRRAVGGVVEARLASRPQDRFWVSDAKAGWVPRLTTIPEPLARFDPAHPRNEPHPCLTLLSTRHEHRGRGIRMLPLAQDLELNDREHRPACLDSGSARLLRPGRRRPSCRRIGRRRGRRRTATTGLLRGARQGRPPIARAQAARAAGMRKPRRSNLVCDPEDALIVSATRLAAGRPDQFRGARGLR